MEHLGIVYALGAAITWGLVYAIDQKILTSLSPVTLLFVHSILASIILLPFFLYNRESISSIQGLPKQIFVFVGITVVLAILANILIFSSIKILGSSTASIIEIAYPFFVVLFSYLIFKATPNIYFFIGGILIFIGSVIIIRYSK